MSNLALAGGDFETVEPIVAIPPVEQDNSSFYLGLAMASVSARDAGISMDIFNVTAGQDRLGNVSLLAGYNYNQYIGVEGRYTTSLTNEDMVVMDGWSLFVKPQYPVSEKFSVYGLLGFGGITLDNEHTPGVVVHNGVPVLENTDVDDNGFQWGLGLSYVVTENIDVFFDYTSLANDMDGVFYTGASQADVDAFTLGLTYKF